MTAALVAGLLAGYGIAVPVGAVGTYLVSLTARTCLRTGVCAALGVATADGLYALAATLGGTALAGALRPVLGPLRWVCVLVLLGLALWGAAGALRAYRGHRLATRAASAPPSPARAFWGLLGITLLNPTTVIYFAALVLGAQASGPAGPFEQAVFVLAAFAASASWQVLLAGGGALLGRALTGPRGRLVTALVASGVMTVLAVRMAVAPG
ncbi:MULTISPECIES: LysE family transporter [Streptomyces]|uniref:LysE family transporter n=1 Tax=Streptomyces dubilierae TaxID=3075533 RepID=A0ABU2PDM4_9ACTN|nr:LysE family transporter [Streptomyces sp. DSM 41921]MDT0390264.1 LysE family transporter [Streptomyces sp. DSM 41921]